MQRYLYLYRTKTPERADETSAALAEPVRGLLHEMSQAGVLLALEGCLPSVHGAKVRVQSGDVVTLDGPFNGQDVISGVMLVQVKTKSDAVEWAKRLLKVLGEGELEIRLLANVAI
ncbi:MAG TPA: YciI family protein [Polyangiales bacterium]|nr:YciI family protein [Polyangiales bacterium]